MFERPQTNVDENLIKDYVSLEVGLRVRSKIERGHLQLPIYRCLDSEGRKVVIKIGVGEEGKKEIEDNLFGYSKIAQIGAEELVPEYLRLIKTPWGPALIMEDLGEDFRERAISPEKTSELFNAFKASMTRAIEATTRLQKDSHERGLAETKGQIKRWLVKLGEYGIINIQISAYLDAINLSEISSAKSAIMLLDLTPDNIFVKGGVVKFIDPWFQQEYLGTPIPGISQFITLAEDIYRIEGFNDTNLRHSEFLEEAGIGLLGLTQDQLTVQIALGRALQYSLSSYVRITGNPKLSRTYATLAVKEVEKISNGRKTNNE